MDRDSKKAAGALPAPAEVPANAMGNAAAKTLFFAPGVRFHPSDEELISYYLKRKVQGETMRLDTIGEIDIYKYEPEDLAVHSKLKTRDKEWYFFSAVEKKCSTGTYMKRATKQGYWKVTCKDNEIRRGDGEVIGMMKTLVFYTVMSSQDRQRTDWVMHEYRLAEEYNQDLPMRTCCVYLKQEIGGRSGIMYAPFLEEEWDDDCERVVDTNRINEISQLNAHVTVFLCVDLNELPRECETDDNNKKVDDEALKRESAAPLPHCVLDKEALPLCVLNKETPLPLVQYKRKRQFDSIGNSNSSSQITQDHCSSTETIIDTSAAEPLENSERVALSVLDRCFNNMLGDLEKEQEPVTQMVHASSLTKKINDLQEEKRQMVEFREKQMLEMMKSEMIVNFLENTIKKLREENEELKKNNSNKEQCS